MSKKSRKVFFPSRDLAMSPRGGLTRGRTAEGRPSPGEQSLGTGVPTHTPGPPLSNRVPPPTKRAGNGEGQYAFARTTYVDVMFLVSIVLSRGACTTITI